MTAAFLLNLATPPSASTSLSHRLDAAGSMAARQRWPASTAGAAGAPATGAERWSSTEPVVRISAVFADGYAANDQDEALQIWNLSDEDVDLTGWQVTSGRGSAAFPSGARIGAGKWQWLAHSAEAFRRSFGASPDWSWKADTDSGQGVVPRLVTTAGGPTLANGGGVVTLLDARGQTSDAVVYGQDSPSDGWIGAPVTAYRLANVSSAHQVLYRKLDPRTRRPVADTDRATDWASDRGDPWLGRRVRFPGWDLETLLRPTNVDEWARLELAIAPDHLHDFLARHLRSAQRTIDLMLYTMDQPELAEVLAERAASGIRVRLLLDGNPAGGIDANERWCAATIASAGGEVYWHDDGGEVRRRYRGAHAKVAVIDGRLALIGSENFSLGSAPNDDRSNGTAGRRGVYLATDAPGVVTWLRDLMTHDLAPDRHADVRPFQPRDPVRGAPLPDYLPSREGGGTGYLPIAPQPKVFVGRFRFRLLSAPESALDGRDGLLGLLAQAGAGDEILVEQLRETPWWGEPASDGAAAVNLRLAGYLAAARRGAWVRILLDAHFDDPLAADSNAAVCAELNRVATAESLALEARTGNPTGGGLHNKMVLLSLHAAADAPSSRWHAATTEYWSHIGSLNGSEMSHKANLEVAIEVESESLHHALSAVFAWDWARSGPGSVHLPYVRNSR